MKLMELKMLGTTAFLYPELFLVMDFFGSFIILEPDKINGALKSRYYFLASKHVK